jgi:hypothetical protein
LREIEAPTLLRQTAKRWRQGCQPYAPGALYPQVYFLRFLHGAQSFLKSRQSLSRLRMFKHFTVSRVLVTKDGVLDRMIGFIATSVTISLNYKQIQRYR